MQPVSASDIPSKAGGEIPRPLSKDEIYRIVKKYGEAAKRAQIAGFDTVEIHGGHSYLLSQFLSPITNKRTDESGGSLENRARFTRLVIEEVRNQVGPFFPIFLRVSADEFMEGGNTLEAGMEAACTAAEVGCTTFLLEKKPYLGGLAAEISKIPDKKRLADFPNYMIHRTNKLKNLFAFTNTNANVDFIKNLKPNIQEELLKVLKKVEIHQCAEKT